MIDIPEKPLYLLNTLWENGFEAYVVGGCVRDSLIGIAPRDWDICTSALPDQIIACFPEFYHIENGIKHGTVGIVADKEVFEITTFRTDGKYSDHRHPDSVQFTTSVLEDLARRDFTINSMAYNTKEGLIDPFAGKYDLKSGIIKCVGVPEERFNEDALRILRAIRFAGRFGFEISTETKKASFENSALLNGLPAERILPEFTEILLCANSGKILNEYNIILGKILPLEEQDYSFVDEIPKDFTMRLAALLCSQTVAGNIEASILKLKLSNKIRTEVSNLIFNYKKGIPKTQYEIKNLISKYGIEIVSKLKFLYRISAQVSNDEYVNFESQLNEILANEDCFNVSDLKINGKDLIRLGAKGVQIGDILNAILDNVLCGKIPNDREAELHLAELIINL